MKSDPVFSMLGLCQKAGHVKSGAFSVEEAVKGKKAYLVIVATDASERTQKSHRDMCTYYKVPIIIYGTRDIISQAIGKTGRVAAAITDERFAEEIMKRLRNCNG